MLFLESAGVPLPVWRWPPHLIAPLSARGICWASCVPPSWCCCHLGSLHLSHLPFSTACLSTTTMSCWLAFPIYSTWELPAHRCSCSLTFHVQPWPGVLSGVVEPGASIDPVLPWLVPLCCHSDQSLPDDGLDHCQWYMPCRGFSFHDGSSSSSGFCCLRYSLSRSSLGAIFLMYYWIFVSYWIVALTLTSSQPPFFCFLYSLRLLDLGWNQYIQYIWPIYLWITCVKL